MPIFFKNNTHFFNTQKQIYKFFRQSKQPISHSEINNFIQSIEKPSPYLHIVVSKLTDNYLEFSFFYIKTSDFNEKTDHLLNVQEDFTFNSTKHYNIGTISCSYDLDKNLKQSYHESVFSTVYGNPPQGKAYFEKTGHVNSGKIMSWVKQHSHNIRLFMT